MKKLITLAALLCTAAMSQAQVTFTYTGGHGYNGNGAEGMDKLFDGNTSTKYCGNAGADCYALVTASEPVFVWGYDITLANDNEGNEGQGYRLVKRWSVFGTNDASVAANPNADGWVTLSDLGRNDFLQAVNYHMQRFFCENKEALSTPYKYFKIVLNEGNGSIVQLSEFSLCYETYKTAIYDWYDSDGGDGSKKAVDLRLDQKWEGWQALRGKYLTIETADGNAYLVKSYSFTTHDDGYWKDRAPKEWKLEGSNDNENWTLVDEQTGGDPIANEYYQTTVFTPANTTDAFRYLRLTLNTMKADAYQQIGEFHVTAVDESVSAQSVYYSARLASTKERFTELSSVLPSTDLWYVEYKALYDTLDGLFAAGNWTGLTATMDEMDAWAGRIALFQTQNAVALDGSSTWGDGHWSQLVDGDEGTKWGGNFSGSEGDPEHVQWVIFRLKEQMQPYFYKLVTGWDTATETARNWKDWDVFGGNFATLSEATSDAAGWVKLDSRTDIDESYLPMENSYAAALNFTEDFSEPYYYYMVKVYKSSGGQQQMSEMKLCTKAEFDETRNPMVERYREFAESTTVDDVEAGQTANLTTFLELYDEMKTTDDAVRLTIVNNQMNAMYDSLVLSKVRRTLQKVVTPVDGVYPLGTAADVMAFATAINDGATDLSAKLTADIDLTGETYVSIGNTSNKFNGSFDGQGHSITFNIDTDQEYVGLIGCATGGASIQNVITRGSVKGSAKVGGILGGSEGSGAITIANCGNEATITATGANAGGIHGCNNGSAAIYTLTNCYNAGTISGGKESASISGWLGRNATVTNCYNIGDVTGIDGSNRSFARWDNGTYTNCYNKLNAGSVGGRTDNYPMDKVTSGELCYKLGSAFTQDLSQAGYPTFGSKTVAAGKWFNDAEDDVFYNLEDGNYTVYQLNLDEGNAKYEVPSNVTAKHVTMARSLKAGVWNTFCSPVALGGDNFSAVKELTDVTADGDSYTMTFSDAAGDIVPGKPYMVQVAEAKTELAATDADVATAEIPVTYDGLTFQGVFAGGTAPTGSFIISDNVFYNVNSTVSLKAFRGYISVAGAGVKALNFNFDGGATSIGEELSSEGEASREETVFNLAGQRLGKVQKGINIVNGKKVVIK